MSVPPSPPPGPGDPRRPDGAPAPTSGRRLPRRWRELVAGTVGALVVAIYVAVSVSIAPDDSVPADRGITSIPRSAAPATPAALRPYTVGSARAPLQLVEYGDFRCPSCVAMLDDDVVGVLAHWVDAGRLRFTWRDFAILGPDSVLAAEAGRAAARQDRFWPMHQELFHAFGSGTLRATVPGLVRIARRAGVPDLARFRRDVVSAGTRGFVARSARVARARGLGSTPTFAANGTRVRTGSMDAAQLEGLLERLWQRLGPAATPDQPVSPEAVTASGDVDGDAPADHGDLAAVAAAGAVTE
ncbi:thioredoxin domain-containing protein [Patulibacter sp. NPDC049589]|uniref:DsbA family protein n=1 Tax=Patulibacter sp. NPDC049589 TaxID=3154731 RepID=UPI00343752CA